MQKTRDRPKQKKAKKPFSLKKSFESLKQKLKNLKPKKAKAPKKQKPKAKKVSLKESFNSFKAKMKNAFKVKIPKKEKTVTPKKQNASKSGKIDFTKAVSGVFVILALVAIIDVFGNMGGTRTAIKYIEPDIVEDGVVLGFTGLSDSSGELTYTDDIANVNSYSLTETGVYVNVSSPLDNMFPFCEIEEFTDSYGNVFVKYPKCYIKFVTNSDGVIDGFKVSNVQAEEDMFIPDCFLDPSDPEGYTYLDYFALGKYEMSGSKTQGYSKSGQTCLGGITRDNARTAARSYGDSSNYYNGYQLQDYSMTVLYNFLCMTYYKTANIQTVYGGRTGAVSSWTSISATGTTDPIEGLNGWNTTTDCVKMLGIENPYGNQTEWCDGIVFSKTNVYMFRLPHNYSDSTIGANSFAYARPSTSGFISAFKPGNTAATKSYVFPTEASGSASTFVGDQAYYTEAGTALCLGGSLNTSSAGLWCLFGGYDASVSLMNIGARLSFRPL